MTRSTHYEVCLLALSSLPSLEEVDLERARRHLLNFVPWVTRGRYARPDHLNELAKCYEAALRGEPQRVVAHAPPRHGKTELSLAFMAWALWRNPRINFSYSTYADRLARSKSRKARALYEELPGAQLASKSLNAWHTPEGGGVIAGGVGGPLTGYGVDIAVVDDPTKNRMDAESKVKRDHLMDWYRDVLRTRIEPNGSVFVFATRWHPDDMSGQLAREGFRYIRLPAIDDAGAALWPKRWSLEALNEWRAEVGEYTWASLFQGQPRPRGGTLFGDPTVYTKAPVRGVFGIGVDLSYTKKTTSDYSCAVVLQKVDEPGKDGKVVGVNHVVEVVRMQCRAPEFKAALRALKRRYPSARIRLYGSALEQGVVDLFRAQDVDRDGNKLEGVDIGFMVAREDKFVRAQPAAAAWNRQLIAVPERAPWLDNFVTEVVNFTGVADDHDDQVDALAAAHDLLNRNAGSYDELNVGDVSSSRRM